jgi:predicted dehydrogenase
MSEVLEPVRRAPAALSRPRVGFLGVGWIGRNRMEAMLADGAIEAVAVADASAEMAEAALALAPGAARARDLDDLLAMDLDGLVIATPSGFWQNTATPFRSARSVCSACRPLGRTTNEVRTVVDAARAADRLLAVDLSYRFTEAARRVRDLVREGALGRVFAADLVFHNAYGPDKPWFYDPALSGGGCVMDLGVHLVDLALWTLDFPEVAAVNGALMAGGAPLVSPETQVEDYATASLALADGTSVRIACSWRLQAGCEADISAAFYGTEGGAALRNVGGSFYDFAAHRLRGVAAEPIAAPPDAWGGRAAQDWARRLAAGERFDPQAERLVQVAAVLDRIYGR